MHHEVLVIVSGSRYQGFIKALQELPDHLTQIMWLLMYLIRI